MSLRPCPECGRVTSSSALRCPYCGFNLEPEAGPRAKPQRATYETLKHVLFLSVLFIFAGALIAAAVLISPEPPEPQPAASDASEAPKSPPPPRQHRREETKPAEVVEKPAEPSRTAEKLKEETKELEEKPVPVPEENEIDELFASARKAINKGDYQTAISACEELLPLLGKDSPEAEEIKHLLYLAKLELKEASGPSYAVTRGLLWLARHQDKDGRWDQDGFHKHCRGAACNGKGTSQYDVAVTSLALLAFLRTGNTHRVGQFKRTFRNGLDWLLSQQQKDGSFRASGKVESWIYNHAIGTLALCEVYGVTRDYHLKKPAQKAVGFILSAQNPGLGWKYEAQNGKNDTSVTGWMVQALYAAKIAGIKVPQSAFDGAINWLDRATNTSGKCGYSRPGDDGSVIRKVNEHYAKLPTMTAVATICRIFCGQERTDPKVQNGVDILMNNLPAWNAPKNDKVDMYYWHYGSLAMNHTPNDKWLKWRSALHKAILENQRMGGCAEGSWNPVGKWGMVGGRIYSTAISILTLRIGTEYMRPGLMQPGAPLEPIYPRPGRKPARPSQDTVTIILKNGISVTGKLLWENESTVAVKVRDSIKWEIPRSQIDRISKNK